MRKIVASDGDQFLYACSCGTVFDCSPCGEENCAWDDEQKCLVCQCPSCKGVGASGWVGPHLAGRREDFKLEGDTLYKVKSALVVILARLKDEGKPAGTIEQVARFAAGLEAEIVERRAAEGKDTLVNRVSRASLLEDVDVAAAVGAHQETLVWHLETTKAGGRKPRMVEWLTKRIAELKARDS